MAKLLGVILAKIQHFLDFFLRSIFKHLKSVSGGKEKREAGLFGFIKKLLKNSASFLGNLGDSFYKEYERLKRKKD